MAWRGPVRTIGSRELKTNLGAVLRAIRYQGEEYAVTHRGRVIARLVPAGLPDAPGPELDALWSEMDALAEEIGRDWPAGLAAADAIAQDRSHR